MVDKSVKGLLIILVFEKTYIYLGERNKKTEPFTDPVL
jgi:hypothetical protein